MCDGVVLRCNGYVCMSRPFTPCDGSIIRNIEHKVVKSRPRRNAPISLRYVRGEGRDRRELHPSELPFSSDERRNDSFVDRLILSLNYYFYRYDA